MSRNLVKQSCVVEAGETRIIDTNELLRRRRENEAREQADQSREGFTSGLDAEEVQIPADGGEGSESGVIKAGEDGKATLDQAREEAREILEKANREAEDIIAAARAQAEAEKRSILDQARHRRPQKRSCSGRRAVWRKSTRKWWMSWNRNLWTSSLPRTSMCFRWN